MNSWSAQSVAFATEPADSQQRRLSSWYAQGLADEFGDRLLMFDNTGGPSLELLRLRPQLLMCPGFENALRERVDLLSQFRHPGFAKVRAVENLVHGHGLTLVSSYVPGKRLSEGFTMLRGPVFAAWVIRQLMPSLASLHQQGRGVAHGALSAERVMMTEDGRLLVVEHVLGSALERLQLSGPDLWTRFRIAANPAARSELGRLDQQGDVFQVGLIALSLLLGRPIAAAEYPDQLRTLFNGLIEGNDQLPVALRSWLGRALQLNGRPFGSAGEADAALAELALEGPAIPIFKPLPAAGPTIVAGEDNNSVSSSSPQPAERRPFFEPRGSRQPIWRRWTIPTLAALVLAQTLVIGWLAYFRAPDVALSPGVLVESSDPGASVVADGQVAGTPPLPLRVSADVKSVRTVSLPPPKPDVRGPNRPAPSGTRGPSASPPRVTPVAASVPVVRTGRIRLISPIEVQLLDGDRMLGSSADASIVTPVGEREFELVNSALGYRAHRVIDIKPGQVTSVSLSMPVGRMSINAVPWAAVSINGSYVGETPLANLEVPIGEHEIVFSHPSLGEQRRTAIVRFDEPTRVSADFR